MMRRRRKCMSLSVAKGENIGGILKKLGVSVERNMNMLQQKYSKDVEPKSPIPGSNFFMQIKMRF